MGAVMIKFVKEMEMYRSSSQVSISVIWPKRLPSKCYTLLLALNDSRSLQAKRKNR